MVLPEAWLFEPFRSDFPPRDYLLGLPPPFAHLFQIARQLAEHLYGHHVVVDPAGKIPRRIVPLSRDLAFDFAQRTFQLRRDASEQGGAGVRGRAAVANFAEREDDFQLF
jgi:hypothetical protein